jgi:hypothetical protein
VYIDRYLNTFGLSSNDLGYIPYAAGAIAAWYAVVACYGAFVGYSEQEGWVTIYALILIINGAIAGVFVLVVLFYSLDFRAQLDAACPSQLAEVSEENLVSFGCL